MHALPTSMLRVLTWPLSTRPVAIMFDLDISIPTMRLMKFVTVLKHHVINVNSEGGSKLS
jgi:hypothetical protein